MKSEQQKLFDQRFTLIN
jgi:hypothetical protein